MTQLYQCLGFFVFWGSIISLGLYAISKAVLLIAPYMHRTWLMQTISYIRFKKRFADWKAKGFAFSNWQEQNNAYKHYNLFLARMEGRMKPDFEAKWLERHLFKKSILTMLHEMMQSEPMLKMNLKRHA